MMPSRLLLAFQAATVAAPPPPGLPCPDQGDAIVVCGRAVAPDRYRLPLRGDRAPIEKTGPPRAEWGLGGGVRMNAHVESGALPQGAVSRRVMLSVKVPF